MKNIYITLYKSDYLQKVFFCCNFLLICGEYRQKWLLDPERLDGSEVKGTAK